MPYKVKSQGGKFCVVNAETGKQVNCHDDKPKALRQLRAIVANEKADSAYQLRGIEVAAGHPVVACCEEGCERAFLDFDKMVEHAEAVHTFNDIERLVSEAVREKYSKQGDYNAKPPKPAIWSWVVDTATDWVVFTVEKGSDMTLYKASYSITDGAVTLGDPVEVKRRTVYEPIKKES